MSKKEKLEQKIMSKPINTDITFEEVDAFLKSKGFTKISGKGDHYKFTHPLLKPHISIDYNGGKVKTYIIKLIQDAINEL